MGFLIYSLVAFLIVHIGSKRIEKQEIDIDGFYGYIASAITWPIMLVLIAGFFIGGLLNIAVDKFYKYKTK